MTYSGGVSGRVRRSDAQVPDFVPAYFAAVFTAPVITLVELGAMAYYRDPDIKLNLTLPDIWFVIRGGVFLLIMAFKIALLISFFPALLLGSVYRRLHGWSALLAAMMFGTLVALFGWYALEAILLKSWHSHLQLNDHALVVALSLAPGLISGWLFHRLASTGTARVQACEVKSH